MYTSLEEAWGTTNRAAPVIDPQYKAPEVQTRVLSASVRTAVARRQVMMYIANVYATSGAAGVMNLLTPRMVREIQISAWLSPGFWDDATVTGVLVCVLAFLVLLDVVRAR